MCRGAPCTTAAASPAFATPVRLQLPRSPVRPLCGRRVRVAVVAPARRRRASSARCALRPVLDSTEMGCASLVAGTMVGAGVLALPAVSAPAGFVPATAALVGAWVYMAAAALLAAEVAEHASCALGRPGAVSLLSQARLALGPAGAALASAAYVFQHVSILVAYVAQGADILTRALHISRIITGAGFLGVLSYALYAFNDEQVDTMNNLLFAGVVLSFAAVLSALIPDAHLDALRMHQDWSAVPRAVPTLLLSCVYHNIVASVSSRLGSLERVRKVIFIGSGVPLAMFVAANAVVLAVTGSTLDGGLAAAAGSNPLADLSAQGGFPALAIDAFSGLAVATSAIGFVEGLNQLWNDTRISVLKEDPKSVAEKQEPSYALSVVPPVVLSALFPGSFLAAIDVGGLYGVTVLFGILPAAMAWRQRYASDVALATAVTPSLPGGRVSLAVMMLLPVVLIVYNTYGMLTG